VENIPAAHRPQPVGPVIVEKDPAGQVRHDVPAIPVENWPDGQVIQGLLVLEQEDR